MSVPGLNGTHAWSIGAGGMGPLAPDGTPSGLMLNTGRGSWPRYKLSAIPGLRSRRESEYSAAAPVGRSGELPRPVVSRGKTVVYDGVIRARSPLELEDAIDRLEAAFEANTLGTMTVSTLLDAAAYKRPANFTWALDGPVALSDTRSIVKTGQTPAWDASGRSVEGFVEGAYCAFRSDSSYLAMGGLNTDPATDANYATIDYALYNNSGAVNIYESGGKIGYFGPVANSDILSITTDAQYVKYWRNAELLRSVARSVGPALHFDSSLYHPNASLLDVSFGQMGQDPYIYRALPTALDIPEEHPPEIAQHRATRGFERRFTLALRMPDPRFYRNVLSRGRGAGPLTIVNQGTAPTDLSLRIFGPVTAPVVTNQLGSRIALTGPVFSGTYAEVDFAARTLRIVGGARDVGFGLDRALTTWWDGDKPGLLPGQNTLTLDGAAGGIRDLEALWCDAYWS